MKAYAQVERTISTHPYHALKSLTAGTRGEPGPWEGLFPFTGGPQRHLPGGPGYPLSPLSPITSCPRKQRKQQTAVLLEPSKSGDGSGCARQRSENLGQMRGRGRGPAMAGESGKNNPQTMVPLSPALKTHRQRVLQQPELISNNLCER